MCDVTLTYFRQTKFLNPQKIQQFFEPSTCSFFEKDLWSRTPAAGTFVDKDFPASSESIGGVTGGSNVKRWIDDGLLDHSV